MCKHLSWKLGQQGEETIFCSAQVNRHTFTYDHALTKVDLHTTEANDSIRRKRAHRLPPKVGVNSRNEFGDAKRFGQVVVRTGIECGDFVRLPIS